MAGLLLQCSVILREDRHHENDFSSLAIYDLTDHQKIAGFVLDHNMEVMWTDRVGNEKRPRKGATVFQHGEIGQAETRDEEIGRAEIRNGLRLPTRAREML